MSTSMFLGRVVLPAAAVLLALALVWHSLRSLAVRYGTGPAGMLAASRTDATPVATAAPERVTAEGRVVAYPGAEVTVGTEVLATIVRMAVHEKAAVHKGDLLVELRADEVQAALRAARARLTEAEVALRIEGVRTGIDRILPALSGREPRAAEPRPDNLASVLARRDAARATVDQLEAESAKYRILAPIDGVVIDRKADPGETVGPASPLLTIVDLKRLRVEAEVDEFDIPRVTLHARATLTAEGYRGHRWRGEVEEIADAVVPRLTRPEDPGRPAETRVLLVKVAFREPNPLRLGQRVEVEIETVPPAADP
ncbi:MAG TPA: efflux RND transporter periplasmic adaptor subunit [Isosphaeraceae bacterium]|nr:efflux RND transporter periplasmic adaptor subunit [Isosphaeraceae bacterium]